MSNVLRFPNKYLLTFIILMMVTSVTGPSTVAAHADDETDSPVLTFPPPDPPAAPIKAAPLGTNLIRDPGFEASYKSTTGPWFQLAPLLDTICSLGDPVCYVNGAGYHDGGGWAAFGVSGNSFDSVYQNVVFPRCGARLKFYLYVGLNIGPGQAYGMDNHFVAQIDDITVFEAYGNQFSSYQPYTLVNIDVSQFANGAVHRVEFFSDNFENYLWFNLDDVALYPTIPASSGCAAVTVKINQTPRGTYGVPQNAGERLSYSVESGPVFVNSTNNIPIVASERVIPRVPNPRYFSEMMGLPDNLKGTRYAFPAYDNLAFDSQLRFANIGNANTTVTVRVGNLLSTNYLLTPNESRRVSFAGQSGGPIVIQSSGVVPIIASLRVVPRPSNGSFSEIMGLPESQWSTSYIFPWYNSASLNTQLRVGNVGSSTTAVKVMLGTQEITGACTSSNPNNSFSLGANASMRVSCNVNNGPLKVVSSGGVPIVASLRVAFKTGSTWTSFSEMMGLPETQLAAGYVFPWYNNIALNTQLRFGNVSNTSTSVRVFIGGQEMTGSPFPLAPGQSLRRSFAVDKGPVVIRSTNGAKIIASLRVLFQNGSTSTAFSELMGLPENQLTTSYLFPYYNNVALNTQLRVGVP
jgi:hypothetical protein